MLPRVGARTAHKMLLNVSRKGPWSLREKPVSFSVNEGSSLETLGLFSEHFGITCINLSCFSFVVLFLKA